MQNVHPNENQIRQAREALGWTQDETARALGYVGRWATNHYAKMERGERPMPYRTWKLLSVMAANAR
jgi:transcriptional regulator with XRE-family HTH domain